VQERVLREQEARMHEAHEAHAAARRAAADRRIDAIAERHDAEPRRAPRIRGF
jgi:hypothetical protein